MKKIIKKICWILLAAIVIFLFVELFFKRIISSNIHFQLLTHYENRTDILTFIDIIATFAINVCIFNLSKKIEEKNDSEKESKRYQSACIVYDYLVETIAYIKKIIFKEKEDYYDLKYNEGFMQEVYNLNDYIFDEKDIEVLRNLDKSLKNYIAHKEVDDNKELVIKWMYKSLFDLNMKIDQIEKMNNLVDTDLLLNVQIVNILAKLRKKLNYQYLKNVTYENIKLSVEDTKQQIIIKKVYDDNNYLENGKGNVQVFEPIFYRKTNTPYRNGGMIYEGKIDNYEKNGNGKYFYYKVENEKNIYINSDDLIDDNAKKIKRTLENDNRETRVNAIVEGQFEHGIIVKGKIKIDGVEIPITE